MEEQLRTLSELLEERRFSGAGAIVKDMNPADAAWILEELPEQRMPVLFRLLPKELAADTFAYMEPESQELLVQGFSDRELDEVMEEALELQEEMQDVQQEMTQENLRKEAAVNAQKAAGEEADLQEAVVYHPFDIKV